MGLPLCVMTNSSSSLSVFHTWPERLRKSWTVMNFMADLSGMILYFNSSEMLVGYDATHGSEFLECGDSSPLSGVPGTHLRTIRCHRGASSRRATNKKSGDKSPHSKKGRWSCQGECLDFPASFTGHGQRSPMRQNTSVSEPP